MTINSSTSSPIISNLNPLEPAPFENSKYTGSINFFLLKNDNNVLISASGERISLETFTEPYFQEYKNKFSFHATPRPEFTALAKIFQNPDNVKQYGDGNINTDAQITKRLNRDSIRPLNGDMFTGFAVVDKKTNEIIGRAAVGSGDEPGESQFGLILRSDYQGNKYGKEASLLMAAVALAFFENNFPVGDDKTKLPVTRFTATALSNNVASRHLLNLGMKPISTLPTGWFQRAICLFGIDKLFDAIGYPLAIRSLYEIKGVELRAKLGEHMDLSKLKIN